MGFVSITFQETQVVLVWPTYGFEDDMQLVRFHHRSVRRRQWKAMLPFEEYFARIRNALEIACPREHLEQDAASAPNVDGLVVLFLDQDDLRRSVPPRNHMRRQRSAVLVSV